MRPAAVLAALCALSLGGCEKAMDQAEAEEASAAAQVQPASLQKSERYDYAQLVAEGLARDKAVYDSGWKPRRPQTELALAPALPIFPTPAALPAQRPTAAPAAPAPDVQVFGRGGAGQRQGDRQGRGGDRGGRGGRGGERGFGGPGGPGGPGGFPGGFQGGLPPGATVVTLPNGQQGIAIRRPDGTTTTTDIPLRFEAN